MEYDPNRKISNRYLRLALRKIESENYCEEIQHRHVAVIVKAGRILAVGRNRNKTHPDSVLYEDGERILKTIHAEHDGQPSTLPGSDEVESQACLVLVKCVKTLLTSMDLSEPSTRQSVAVKH